MPKSWHSRRLRRSHFDADKERDVLETVRASFSAPRKTIRNALSHALAIDSMQTVRALERAAIDPGARAEKLGVPDFLDSRMRCAPNCRQDRRTRCLNCRKSNRCAGFWFALRSGERS